MLLRHEYFFTFYMFGSLMSNLTAWRYGIMCKSEDNFYMVNKSGKEHGEHENYDGDKVVRSRAEILKIRNQDNFQPLVEIKEADLKRLLKFGLADSHRNLQDRQQLSKNRPTLTELANLRLQAETRAVNDTLVADTFGNSAAGHGVEAIDASEIEAAGNAAATVMPLNPAMYAASAPPAASRLTSANVATAQEQGTMLNYGSQVALKQVEPKQAVPQQTSRRSPVAASHAGGGKRKYIYIISALVLCITAIIVFLAIRHFYGRNEEMNFSKRLAKYEAALIASARETGVWPSVTAAQLFIEAGDGPNKLADDDNNGFGLKWHDNMARRHRNQAWPVTYQTQEYLDGQYVTIDDLFAKFAHFEIGIWEHDRIWWNGYHEEARQVLMDLDNGTREQFIEAILHYATAPEYRDAIRKVIKEQNLDYLDAKAFPDGKRLQAGFADMAVSEFETKLAAAKQNATNAAGDASAETAPDLAELQAEAEAEYFISRGTYPDDGNNAKDLADTKLATLFKDGK